MATSTNITVTHAGNGLLVCEVREARRISPSFVRLTLGGEALQDWRHLGFDQWFRLAVPNPNETRFDNLSPRFGMGGYLRYLTTPKATRPEIRSYTVRTWRPETSELDVDFLIHGDSGQAGPWAAALPVGDEVALIDQGHGFRPDRGTNDVLLVGDATALPAVLGILRDPTASDSAGSPRRQAPAQDRQRSPRSSRSPRRRRRSTRSSPASRSWQRRAGACWSTSGASARTESRSAATGGSPPSTDPTPPGPPSFRSGKLSSKRSRKKDPCRSFGTLTCCPSGRTRRRTGD